jgi:molybdopterin/thiamine biosynthesis adenylyltransferase
MELTEEQRVRYSRHLVLPRFGLDGQKALRRARVLIVGTGGLGSPAAIYLAACGVGTLGLVDFDTVELANLQRQILHATPEVGAAKVDSAARHLQALNPDTAIEKRAARLDEANAAEIVGAYDLVVDGTDNFPSRYLLNEICARLGKPYVYGAIFRFQGQTSVFDARRGPCYRCLYPDRPSPEEATPSAAEAGVLGVVPGVVGSIQATEAVKLIVGQGRPLIGRLLLYDALEMAFREIPLRRDLRCPVCGAGA